MKKFNPSCRLTGPYFFWASICVRTHEYLWFRLIKWETKGKSTISFWFTYLCDICGEIFVFVQQLLTVIIKKKKEKKRELIRHVIRMGVQVWYFINKIHFWRCACPIVKTKLILDWDKFPFPASYLRNKLNISKIHEKTEQWFIFVSYKLFIFITKHIQIVLSHNLFES